MCFSNVCCCFIVGFAALILVTHSLIFVCARIRCSLHLAMFIVWKRETNTQSIIVIKVHLICNFYSIVMNSLLWKVARQWSFHLSDAHTVCGCYFVLFLFFLFLFQSHVCQRCIAYAFHAATERRFKWKSFYYWMEKLENRFSGGYKEFIEMARLSLSVLLFAIQKKWLY